MSSVIESFCQVRWAFVAGGARDLIKTLQDFSA